MVIGLIIAEGAVRHNRLHPKSVDWEVDTKVYSVIVVFWLLYLIGHILDTLGFTGNEH